VTTQAARAHGGRGIAERTRYTAPHSTRLLRPGRSPRARGFTLIELMITLLVFSIGLLALAKMMPAGSRSMNRARTMTSAATLAAQKIEDLKVLAWTSPSLGAGTYNDASGSYSRTWSITDNVPLPGTKKITVTVSYAISGGTRSTAVSTYLTQVTN
jgi:type IV pilus assembly protein PilV